MKPILPEAALGSHIAVLGKTGSGKTFAAKAAIVEPVLEAGRRVGIVDPTDAWWGLRSSSDGKGAGFPVIVLGGDHGDLPLPANGGAAVARLLIEQRINLVASTKHLTIGERTRWFIDFAGTINRVNRQPLHLVIDEAHNFAPQGKVPDPDTGKMLHAANALASEGRSKGIRLVMITQRPQKLHKDTLTCAETLIAMRVLAPHDRLAIEDWIKGCGDMGTGKEVLNSLAGLQRGEGWIWYPEGNFLKRVKFPAIRTFDSSATPTDGHAIQSPKGAAEIDLTEIRAALADAVKEAEANDPKLLRAQLAEAQRQLAQKSKSQAAGDALDRKFISPRDHEHAAAAAEREGRAAGWNAALDAMQPIADRMGTVADAMLEAATAFQSDLKKRRKDAPPSAKPHAQLPGSLRAPAASRQPAAVSSGHVSVTVDVSGPQQRILDALAWLEAVGVQDAQRTQLALLAKASPTSSSYQNNLGHLRKQLKLIDYADGSRIFLTPDGRAVARSPATPPTTADLHRTLQEELSGPQWRILEELIKRYPEAVDKMTLADLAGASVSSSSYQNNLGTLRSLGFIDYPSRGDAVALPVLFLER